MYSLFFVSEIRYILRLSIAQLVKCHRYKKPNCGKAALPIIPLHSDLEDQVQKVLVNVGLQEKISLCRFRK